jgi:hypothetical protein
MQFNSRAAQFNHCLRYSKTKIAKNESSSAGPKLERRQHAAKESILDGTGAKELQY